MTGFLVGGRVLTRNVPLLRGTLAHIKADPEGWDQTDYRNFDAHRCRTVLCYAGWLVELTGGKWAFPADSRRASYVLAEDADGDGWLIVGGKRVVYADDRAARVTGLTSAEAEELFESGNGIPGLERIVEEICAEAEAEAEAGAAGA